MDLYRSLIRNHFPLWANIALRDLSAQAKLVAERHRDISTKSGPGVANQAMRLLRALYRHADNFDLDEAFGDLPIKNPTRQVIFNKDVRRSTGMNQQAMAEWNVERLALPSPIQVEFQLMMILSGSRPDALKRARWSDLDLKVRTLHFPDPKGGSVAKYSIPLSRQMLYCLVRARRAGRMLHWTRSKEFIFPGPGKTGHLWNTQCRGKLSQHGGSLRQTYVTSAQAVGIPWVDVKLLVNHRDSDITSGYTTPEALVGPLRVHQERISKYILAGLEENT